MGGLGCGGLPPKWAIRGEQLCIAHSGEPSPSECGEWEVEDTQATTGIGATPEGHHLKAKVWILPGNAFNFPKGTIEEID